jgi:hypothetical protein
MEIIEIPIPKEVSISPMMREAMEILQESSTKKINNTSTKTSKNNTNLTHSKHPITKIQ